MRSHHTVIYEITTLLRQYGLLEPIILPKTIGPRFFSDTQTNLITALDTITFRTQHDLFLLKTCPLLVVYIYFPLSSSFGSL